MKFFWQKKTENIEDKKNRIESAVKQALQELPLASHKIEIMRRVLKVVDPYKRIYTAHNGRGETWAGLNRRERWKTK